MLLLILAQAALSIGQPSARTFAIGPTDFLLDGKPVVIRSGEMHAARVPREYWRHRLQMIKAMGCNTVCAYLFWNQHEPRPGEFDFTAEADAAEYCRIAQEVGLWVILRPGPYSCAEWDFGGLPWWLLKTPDIQVRTRDPRYLEAVERYLLQVGMQLAPLQVTRGGPIIMVQVENEYGSYGTDKEYIGALRDTLKTAGFDVPLFTCDGPSQLKNDVRDDIFCVVNFGGDPERNFKPLREIRPTGPLMCGEYYPGWFDSWGKPHHTGDSAKIVRELGSMLENRQSFSIYMAHGGTSFGFTAGANSPPFSPQTTSYDYDAPIDEAGRATPKFHALRELFSKHLNPGETLPEIPPSPAPIIEIPELMFTQAASLFDNLPAGKYAEHPIVMEALDQSHGCVLYRTRLSAGPAGTLIIRNLHDYGQIYLDGDRIGLVDRRHTRAAPASIPIPQRDKSLMLEILVEAMGRVNFGGDIHDRKGITERVELVVGGRTEQLRGWDSFSLPLSGSELREIKYVETKSPLRRAAFYRASFDLATPGDTFLDVSAWGKGIVWVNGHNLGRYWDIGPTQTMYLPGCWLRQGTNEIVIFELVGGAQKLSIAGRAAPTLDDAKPDPFAPRKHRTKDDSLKLDGLTPVATGAFDPGPAEQTVRFSPTAARFIALEAQNSQADEPFTSCAELFVLAADGSSLPREKWKLVYADSEEVSAEDGLASNIFDNQPTTIWHTQWETSQPKHPHAVVIDLGASHLVSGIRYLPRQDSPNGRIREFRLFLADELFPGIGPH